MDKQELINWIQGEIQYTQYQYDNLGSTSEPTEITYLNGKIMAFTQVLMFLEGKQQ